MVSPDNTNCLGSSVSRAILEQLTEALQRASCIDHQLARPVLRIEAFIQDGDDTGDDGGRIIPNGPTIVHSPSPNTTPEPERECDAVLTRRRSLAALRLRPQPSTVLDDAIDSHRRMQIAEHNFPKRAKTQADVVPIPDSSSLDKFITGVWENIHGGVHLEPQSLVEQLQLTAAAAVHTLTEGDGPPSLTRSANDPVRGPGRSQNAAAGNPDSFSWSNVFCRKVTQASRTCRSIEVIVQAHWVEQFDAYVDFLAATNPNMSLTKCRKAALMGACRDFEWSEKELRNKMAVWRGYKQIKDAAGWAALVFAGMGLYRLCKYRTDFNTKSMERLSAFRRRIEVAADTLHPSWRQLLALVGEIPERRFTGHPHDWVVFPDGSDPVPLHSTYIKYDPCFSFQHMDESTIDSRAWDNNDPRWIPPPSAALSLAGANTCRACAQSQSDDPKLNSCFCFPSLFGGLRPPCPVQVFRTPDGRNNGLQALVGFERGAAIGEFVGLVTRGIEDLDVMESAAVSHRPYQIWQGRQGNFTRFVNHSCKPNAQYQHFVWLGIQRVVLVSKGIDAGTEITVDYSESYWRGLDKRCLCGEGCCRYNGDDRP
ncbi:hypothetical protein N658DRAFT_515287 [Parathielavia hyrcaniae]|uniref:SET domain-containing protein n=1 Tax=Parathielavia hyrcaniae TaxID=113614 RepID=A0AAN6T3G3_9PEZI|nr:hypothetical protein N658DRAFT_515287 [Parathielavia hyrcaniae]